MSYEYHVFAILSTSLGVFFRVKNNCQTTAISDKINCLKRLSFNKYFLTMICLTVCILNIQNKMLINPSSCSSVCFGAILDIGYTENNRKFHDLKNSLHHGLYAFLRWVSRSPIFHNFFRILASLDLQDFPASNRESSDMQKFSPRE